VSFLNQLKEQASALQSAQVAQHTQHEANTRLTDAASKTAWLYVSDLARQLNVIHPAGPTLSLDGKTPWPAMKLVDFQADARKKKLRDQEVFDYIALGWRLVPQEGTPLPGSVSANFPPDLQRIETRLSNGGVKHERVNVRHPEKNTLQAIRFDYLTEARGGVTITADHRAGALSFRLSNVQAFDLHTVVQPAGQIQSPLLDELAKLILGQASRFV
jgi:hypothetical protein